MARAPRNIGVNAPNNPTPSFGGRGRVAPSINNTQSEVAKAAAAINRPKGGGLKAPGMGPKSSGGIPDHGQCSPKRGGLPAN